MSKQKDVIKKYAQVAYVYYTKENKVMEMAEYPDYIADEINLGFSIPFIKGIFKEGLLEVKEGVFSLTAQGEKLLEDNQEYIDFFNLGSPYISIEEFEEYSKDKRDELSFEQRLYDIFLEKLKDARTKKKHVDAESLLMELAQLAIALKEERQALLHYMANLSYSMSGIKEYKFIRRYKNRKITQKELLDQYKDCVYVAPQVIVGIEELKDFYEETMVDEVYDFLKLGYNLCSRQRFKELMNTIIAGEYNNSMWQEQITDVFTKKMGFKTQSDKKVAAKKEDLGEPEQEVSAIIGTDEKEAPNAISDAKLAEIAEEESKNKGI